MAMVRLGWVTVTIAAFTHCMWDQEVATDSIAVTASDGRYHQMYVTMYAIITKDTKEAYPAFGHTNPASDQYCSQKCRNIYKR